jgi:Flp pilus assembly protein TadD
MSVLNQMLDDLSARGALLPAGNAAVAPGVLAAEARPAPRRGVRRVVWSGLALCGVALVGGLLWMQEQARDAQLSGRPRAVVASAPVAAEPPVAAMPVVAAAAQPAPVDIQEVRTADSTPRQPPASAAVPRRETVAREVEPRRAGAPRPAMPRVQGTAAAPAVRPAAAADSAATPASTSAGATPTDPPAIERRLPAGQELAAEMARASELIARGRNTEAIALLRSVLARDAAQAPARAALAALLAEAGQRDAALATLLDGVKVDALRFAMPAARLQHDLGDTAGALATLGSVPPLQQTGAHHALAGGLAYQAGRYGEAIDAYRRAVSSAEPQPVWWLGLGLALEAAGQGAEAHAAFARLASARALPADMQRFVAQRLAATAAAAARGPAAPAAAATAADSLAAGLR